MKMAKSATSGLARIAALALGASKAEDDENENTTGKKSKDEKDESAAEDENTDDESGKEKDEDESAAEDDEDDENASEDDEDESAAEDDEDDDKKSKKARKAERARVAAIIGSKAASRSENHMAQAMFLALNTGMSVNTAIGMLQCMPHSSKSENAGASTRQQAQERLARTPDPKVQAETVGAGQPSLAQQIVAAGDKARGENK